MIASDAQRSFELQKLDLERRNLEIERLQVGHYRNLLAAHLEFDRATLAARETAAAEVEQINEALRDTDSGLTGAQRSQLETRKGQLQADLAVRLDTLQRFRDAALADIEAVREAEAAARARQPIDGALGTGVLRGAGNPPLVSDREVYGSPDGVRALLGVGLLDTFAELDTAASALDQALAMESTDEGRERIRELRKELDRLRSDMEGAGESVLASTSTNLQALSEVAAEAFDQTGEKSAALWVASKALAASSAIINTYLAATKALAEGGPIAGPILAATMVAQGLLLVNKIRTQTPDGAADTTGGGRRQGVTAARGYKSGGLVVGGEQQITVNEGGQSEFVVSAGPTRRYRDVLDAINRGADPAEAVAAHLRQAQRPVRALSDRLAFGGPSRDGDSLRLGGGLDTGALAAALADGARRGQTEAGAMVATAIKGIRVTTKTRGGDLLTVLDNAARDQARALPDPGALARLLTGE